MFKPEVVVLDFETALTNGEPSTEYYREDFRAISAAFAWVGEDGTVKTTYLEGEGPIGTMLLKIQSATVPVVVHNLQFEYGVCLHRFPGSESIVQIDTMRLVQNADNGGRSAHWDVKPQTYEDMLDAVESEDDTPKHSTGLGLVSAASRWLPEEYQNHKEPFHALIRERVKCKKGQEGKNLNALSADELRRYNVRDAEVTLALYQRLTEKFREDRFDWRLDHTLYGNSARLISKAKGVGIQVDQVSIGLYRDEVEQEIESIGAAFRTKFLNEIREIETEAMLNWANALKTVRGREQRLLYAQSNEEEFRFNVGSNQQLATLFVNKLGIEPKFTTATGQPSFKSTFLSQWGEGGEILKKRRKRLLVLKQCESLIALSEWDGLWHVDLKVCGPATGRFAGGRV